MTNPADDVLAAGMRDAELALTAIGSLGKQWADFAVVCQAQKFDLAEIQGQRLVALVETAVDLYLSSNRRISQYTKLAQGDKS